jgi:glycine hydroxymethyltransferase
MTYQQMESMPAVCGSPQRIPADPMSTECVLESVDPEVARLVAAEEQRQQDCLELIASENHCSAAVLEAVGSVLTDKYAEGYPGARWYEGCGCVDAVEDLARERARELFGAEHANVQPHSGSQANMAVYLAMLRPGDRILGMSLAHGGHLTHGHARNYSGRTYEIISYGVDEDGLIDYEQVERLARQYNPSMIVTGSSTYSRAIDFERFRTIADEVGAYLMADIAHISGLIAAGVHPSPVPHAHFVTSSTHKTLRGPRGGFILCRETYGDRIDSAVFPGIQGGPLMHSIAGKAVAFKLAMSPDFRAYQQQVAANARAMAGECDAAGFPIVSGGTDTHMFLLDIRETGMSGLEAAHVLAGANIILNKNLIPNDPRSPREASGIRLGSPAVTTRGMKEADVSAVARWVCEILEAESPADAARGRRSDVIDMCVQFPARR